MSEVPVRRKLTAILHADVVNYSRLSGTNEEATHRALSSALDLIGESIEKHQGKVVNTAGDAVLAEFESVVSAVECALAFQDQLSRLDAVKIEDVPLQFRVGINLGEVIIDRDDIFGDGVNVAARIESIADPGGICISGSVFDQVKGRIEIEWEDMGPQSLKNIHDDVRVYKPMGVASQKPGDIYEALTGEKFEIPDNPSIAVLPFQNISGDPDQEHFADGMTEDIITSLSYISGMVVIARNSTMVYKNRAVDLRQVGNDLGVAYLLEGSVRKSGNRVRITAQLINATNGDHIWAERYDRNLDDIFEVQDEITRTIVTALSVKLAYGEESRVWSERAGSYEAWELTSRAMSETYKITLESNRESQRLSRRALEMEPENDMACVALGYALILSARYQFTDNPADAVAEAKQRAFEALARDGDYGDAHALLGYAQVTESLFDEAVSSALRTVELSPGVATNNAIAGLILCFACEFDLAEKHMTTAMRLSPYWPPWFTLGLGLTYMGQNKPSKAIAAVEYFTSRSPESYLGHLVQTWAHIENGNQVSAESAAKSVLEIAPKFSVDRYFSPARFKDPAVDKRYRDAMLKAGLPE